METLGRWRSGAGNQPGDLYPVVAPENLSDRLHEFISAIDRCTTKRFAILDTMPGRLERGHLCWDNFIDTICHPEVNFVLLDAARMPETIIAHEFGHAWIQYVDQCEDYRTLSDPTNASRLRMLNYIQSVVLDLKVNDLLRTKGFDMSPIEADEQGSLASWARASHAGYTPALVGEEVFMATAVATEIVRREQGTIPALVRKDDPLPAIRKRQGRIYNLALQMAASITSAGYESRSALLRSIDECLVLAFKHCGEHIDLERDLVIVNPSEPNIDKYPGWLPPLSPRGKCEVGRYMARNDISTDWRQSLARTATGHAHVSFHCPESGQRSVVIDETIGPPTHYSHLPSVIAEAQLIMDENETRRRTSFPTFPPMPTLPNANRPMELNYPKPHVPPFGVPRRSYTAGAARFCTMVQEAEWVGGEHPYAYAMNNPILYTDPTGNGPGGPTQACGCCPASVSHSLQKCTTNPTKYPQYAACPGLKSGPNHDSFGWINTITICFDLEPPGPGVDLCALSGHETMQNFVNGKWWPVRNDPYGQFSDDPSYTAIMNCIGSVSKGNCTQGFCCSGVDIPLQSKVNFSNASPSAYPVGYRASQKITAAGGKKCGPPISDSIYLSWMWNSATDEAPTWSEIGPF